MFFPSRAFAQQQNEQSSYTPSYYRGYAASNNIGGYNENQPAQSNYYSRNYDFKFKPQQQPKEFTRNVETVPTYSGALLFRPSGYTTMNTDQNNYSRYYGGESYTSKYSQGGYSKYSGGSYDPNKTCQPSSSTFQYRSRYDRINDNNLESKYGIKVSNERSFYQPQQHQPIPAQVQPSAFKSEIGIVEKQNRKRAKSVNTCSNYKSDLYEPDQPPVARNCEYLGSQNQNKTSMDYSIIAQKYGAFRLRKEQSNFQRKYPLILTNDKPMFADQVATQNEDESSSNESESSSSSSPEMTCKTQKRHKNEVQNPAPFDPNRQLFSQAQNDVFQKYAEQRINELRASKGQPPAQRNVDTNDQCQSASRHLNAAEQYQLNAHFASKNNNNNNKEQYPVNFDKKSPYESCFVNNGSGSKRNASAQRKPEVKFAFKNDKDQHETNYQQMPETSSKKFQYGGTTDDVNRPKYTTDNKSINLNDQRFDFKQQQQQQQQSQQPPSPHLKKQQSPKQHSHKHQFQQQKQQQTQVTAQQKKAPSSESDDKEDSADLLSRLAKFRKTIEESKNTERQLGELLGCSKENDTHKAHSSTDDNNNALLSETDSLSAKANPNEFLSEPSLVFEEN